MASKAFVLLSGGLDSTTVLFWAFQHFKDVEALSVDYGQRHKKEMEFARSVCDEYGVRHSIVSIPDVLRGGMLTNPTQEIPNASYDELVGVSPTYVPFRNGTMLSIIAAHAQRWVNEADGLGNVDAAQATIMFGAHAEDAQNWAYPDCTPEFIGAMANAIYVGTYHRARLVTPLMFMSKAEIVAMGARLKVPFENTWSCYAGGEAHCGTCPTCRARKDAFAKAGIHDPTIYAFTGEQGSKGIALKANFTEKDLA